MYRYAHKNVRPFSAVCRNNYGRQVIFTRKRQITKNNIIEELNKALVIHEQNAIEIEYLDRYYRGDQPILYRQKVNRPEINNKIAVNLAYELVERKTAEMCAEPIQYVLRGTDNHKSEEITQLNITMAFAFFLGLSVAYGIKTASIIVGAIVTVFWLILIAICLIEEGEPHEKKEPDIDVINFNDWNYDLKANSSESR